MSKTGSPEKNECIDDFLKDFQVIDTWSTEDKNKSSQRERRDKEERSKRSPRRERRTPSTSKNKSRDGRLRSSPKRPESRRKDSKGSYPRKESTSGHYGERRFKSWCSNRSKSRSSHEGSRATEHRIPTENEIDAFVETLKFANDRSGVSRERNVPQGRPYNRSSSKSRGGFEDDIFLNNMTVTSSYEARESQERGFHREQRRSFSQTSVCFDGETIKRTVHLASDQIPPCENLEELSRESDSEFPPIPNRLVFIDDVKSEISDIDFSSYDNDNFTGRNSVQSRRFVDLPESRLSCGEDLRLTLSNNRRERSLESREFGQRSYSGRTSSDLTNKSYHHSRSRRRASSPRNRRSRSRNGEHRKSNVEVLRYGHERYRRDHRSRTRDSRSPRKRSYNDDINEPSWKADGHQNINPYQLAHLEMKEPTLVDHKLPYVCPDYKSVAPDSYYQTQHPLCEQGPGQFCQPQCDARSGSCGQHYQHDSCNVPWPTEQYQGPQCMPNEAHSGYKSVPPGPVSGSPEPYLRIVDNDRSFPRSHSRSRSRQRSYREEFRESRSRKRGRSQEDNSPRYRDAYLRKRRCSIDKVSMSSISSVEEEDNIPPAPPPPRLTGFTDMEQPHSNIYNKDRRKCQFFGDPSVNLSSILEAAMDDGSIKKENMKYVNKMIVTRCEEKITKLYRRRISGEGCFIPDIKESDENESWSSPFYYWNSSCLKFNRPVEHSLWRSQGIRYTLRRPDISDEKLVVQAIGNVPTLDVARDKSYESLSQAGYSIQNYPSIDYAVENSQLPPSVNQFDLNFPQSSYYQNSQIPMQGTFPSQGWSQQTYTQDFSPGLQNNFVNVASQQTYLDDFSPEPNNFVNINNINYKYPHEPSSEGPFKRTDHQNLKQFTPFKNNIGNNTSVNSNNNGNKSEGSQRAPKNSRPNLINISTSNKITAPVPLVKEANKIKKKQKKEYEQNVDSSQKNNFEYLKNPDSFDRLPEPVRSKVIYVQKSDPKLREIITSIEKGKQIENHELVDSVLCCKYNNDLKIMLPRRAKGSIVYRIHTLDSRHLTFKEMIPLIKQFSGLPGQMMRLAKLTIKKCDKCYKKSFTRFFDTKSEDARAQQSTFAEDSCETSVDEVTCE